MVILQKRVPGLTEDTLDRFVTRAKRSVGLRGSVTVLVTSSRELRRLNQRFRGKDTPTDVLSFPAPPNDPAGALGDIAIENAVECLIADLDRVILIKPRLGIHTAANDKHGGQRKQRHAKKRHRRMARHADESAHDRHNRLGFGGILLAI